MIQSKRKGHWKILRCKFYGPNEVLADLRTSLKLKVYRSLGIDVDPDLTGSHNKATIRNAQRGDVHVVNIDDKYSRFFYANYFWQTL